MQSDGTSENYTTRQVTFRHAFRLGKSSEEYPPGVYCVQTAEEVHEGLERNIRVRKSTVLVVPTSTGTCDRSIDHDQLEDALERDRRRSQG